MRLVRIWGIDIKINVFFGIIVTLFFIFGYVEKLVISFFIVFLHEVAHALMAKILGYRIEEIEIFPFGGVTRIEGIIGVSPWHEILIALMGPISNFLLSFMGYQIYVMFNIKSEWLIYSVYSNLIIGIFNLIPVIPLDGGRVLRAYLSHFLGIKNATKTIVILSKVICIFLMIFGLYATQYNRLNVIVTLIAIFIYIAANKEYKMAVFIFMKEITEKKQHLLEKGILSTKHLVAVKNTSAKVVIEQFVPQKYHVVTVMDKHCNVIGFLTESELLDGIMKFGLNVSLEKLLFHR